MMNKNVENELSKLIKICNNSFLAEICNDEGISSENNSIKNSAI